MICSMMVLETKKNANKEAESNWWGQNGNGGVCLDMVKGMA